MVNFTPFLRACCGAGSAMRLGLDRSFVVLLPGQGEGAGEPEPHAPDRRAVPGDAVVRLTPDLLGLATAVSLLPRAA